MVCAVSLQTATAPAQPVIRVAAGGFHSLFLKADGSLWAMGLNYYGELGDNTFNSTNRPEMIVSSNVTAIAGGGFHSLFLKADGSLWAMGKNEYGQLGDGTYRFSNPWGTNIPEQIVNSNVVAIAAGYNHSLFLKSDGSLWSMGDNSSGQLGDGTYNTRTNHPEEIVSSNVVAIAAGYNHSLFLKSDGSLWGMGEDVGQLGDGNYGILTNRPEQALTSGVTTLAAGGSHSLFLKSGGSLWAMGFNQNGQLGDGTYYATNLPEQIVASGVTTVAAGASHSLFLQSGGSLWAMGDNQDGQLGDGTYSTNANFGINQPEQIVASGVTAISGGQYHSLFLKRDGSLWGMGRNADGQLGDGTTNDTNLPEQIVAPLSGYNQISVQLLSGGGVQLSFVGLADVNYALDRSSSLVPPNWVPLVTNRSDAGGGLVLTDRPEETTNNFWRIRYVP